MLPIFEDEPPRSTSGQTDSTGSKAPNGAFWWELDFWPGTKRRFGGEPKICAWLWFNKDIGEFFTMRELREKIGGDIADDSEHFNRRLRTLRANGWVMPTNRDDTSIPVDCYRLDQKGRRIWLKSEPKVRNAISQRTRRIVLERDGSRCQVCGVGDGESYPGEPESTARLTIGHRTPQERIYGRQLADDIDNLRTECSRCNEPVRDEMPDPEKFDEVLSAVRRLRVGDRRSLLAWLQAGQRSRSSLDFAYDRARKLSHQDRTKLINFLKKGV